MYQNVLVKVVTSSLPRLFTQSEEKPKLFLSSHSMIVLLNFCLLFAQPSSERFGYFFSLAAIIKSIKAELGFVLGVTSAFSLLTSVTENVIWTYFNWIFTTLRGNHTYYFTTDQSFRNSGTVVQLTSRKLAKFVSHDPCTGTFFPYHFFKTCESSTICITSNSIILKSTCF